MLDGAGLKPQDLAYSFVAIRPSVCHNRWAPKGMAAQVLVWDPQLDASHGCEDERYGSPKACGRSQSVHSQCGTEDVGVVCGKGEER